MSCSSKRNRLVGSCINTLVSSTNNLLGGWRRDAGPGLPARADVRETRVSGVGRILRSTMGLLFEETRQARERRPADLMLDRGLREHKRLYERSADRGTDCGSQWTDRIASACNPTARQSDCTKAST